jgi:hypothetical protein
VAQNKPLGNNLANGLLKAGRRTFSGIADVYTKSAESNVAIGARFSIWQPGSSRGSPNVTFYEGFRMSAALGRTLHGDVFRTWSTFRSGGAENLNFGPRTATRCRNVSC